MVTPIYLAIENRRGDLAEQSVQGSGINSTSDGNLAQPFKMGSLARISDSEEHNLLFWPRNLSFYRELILRVEWRGIFTVIVFN